MDLNVLGTNFDLGTRFTIAPEDRPALAEVVQIWS